jgi:hypothetical protein
MIPDPTDEIRAIRDRLAANCDYDLDRIVEETRQHQRESGRQAVAVPRRQSTATSKTNQTMHPSDGSGELPMNAPPAAAG